MMVDLSSSTLERDVVNIWSIYLRHQKGHVVGVRSILQGSVGKLWLVC